MGVSSVERRTDTAGGYGQGFVEFVEALSKMVQNGSASERLLGHSRQDYTDLYKNKQRENAGHAASPGSDEHDCRRCVNTFSVTNERYNSESTAIFRFCTMKFT